MIRKCVLIALLLVALVATSVWAAITEKTVCVGGTCDYSSLSNWEAGRQGTLNDGDGERAICSAGSGEDTTRLGIGGWTLNGTGGISIDGGNYFFHITGASSEAGNSPGVWTTSRYRLVVDLAQAGVPEAFYVNSNHTTALTGIQFKVTLDSGGSAQVRYGIYAHPSMLIDKCYIWVNFPQGLTPRAINVANSTEVTYRIKNTVIRDVHNSDYSGGTAVYLANTSSSSHFYFYNNTLHDVRYGFADTHATAGRMVLINNVVDAANVDGYYTAGGGFHSGSDYNVSNISGDTTGGANDVSNASCTFVDVANHNLHLADNDTVALDTGTNLYADANLPVTIDIDGDARPAEGAFCRGIDEFVASAGQPYRKRLGGIPGALGNRIGVRIW